MKTLEELLAIKAKAQANITTRESADGSAEVTRIVVGMATCGIAAGARPVLNGFVEEVSQRNLKNVTVSQTGCIGMCQYEPIVEVFAPGKEKVTYIKMTPDKIARVVADHIVNGNPVAEYTVPDFVDKANRRVFQLPGIKYITVNLPDEVLGKERVYIRLRPTSTKVGTATTYEGGSSISSSCYNAINYVAIRYNNQI